MEDAYSINTITWNETLHLRQKILRPHQSKFECKYTGDDDRNTVHFGCFIEEKIVGILSLYKRNSKRLEFKNGWQFRAMAIESEYRGIGLASKLLHHVECHAKDQGARYVWANARESALGFYQKMDYEVVGKPFDLPDVGTHFLIVKVWCE